MILLPKRRALLLGTLLSPAVWAASNLAPISTARPVDLIRHLMNEVLTSPEQRAAEARLRQRDN